MRKWWWRVIFHFQQPYRQEYKALSNFEQQVNLQSHFTRLAYYCAFNHPHCVSPECLGCAPLFSHRCCAAWPRDLYYYLMIAFYTTLIAMLTLGGCFTDVSSARPSSVTISSTWIQTWIQINNQLSMYSRIDCSRAGSPCTAVLTHLAFMCSTANSGINVIPFVNGFTILVGDFVVIHIA